MAEPDCRLTKEEIKNTGAESAAFCKVKGVDIAQLAVQFALKNPDIHTTLVGTAYPDNMRRNVEWLSAPYDEALAEKVLKILAPI